MAGCLLPQWHRLLLTSTMDDPLGFCRGLWLCLQVIQTVSIERTIGGKGGQPLLPSAYTCVGTYTWSMFYSEFSLYQRSETLLKVVGGDCASLVEEWEKKTLCLPMVEKHAASHGGNTPPVLCVNAYV